MPNSPDLHPITGEPTRIVVGVMSPMTPESARIGGRAQARAESRALVDLDNARDIASRRVGPHAEAAIGRALLKLAEQPGADLQALAQASREILHLAEGVVSGKPSPIAVKVASRMVDPAWVTSQRGEDAMDLVVLAYATLHLDEKNRMDGGLP